MKRQSIRAEIFLALDGFLLLACLFHIQSLRDANSPPFGLVLRQEGVHVGEISDPARSAELQGGDKILLWQDLPVRSPETIEFFSNLSSRGAQVQVTYQRRDSVASAMITLAPEYDSLYLFIVYFVGIVTWAVGVFVLVKRRDDVTAGILHWALVGLGVSVMMTRGAVSAEDVWSYLSRVLFFVSYLGGVATFFLFTAMFPRPKPGSLKSKSWLVFGPAGVILAGVLYNHMRAIYYSSVDAFMAFDRWYDILGVSLFLYVGGGLFNLFHSAFTAGSSEERKKLKWILWGLAIGPTPFLLLSKLPRLLLSKDIVSEEFTIVFLLVIPFAFAVSFIKYRLLDVEVVINRTTVYALVLGALTASYYSIVVAGAMLIGTSTERLSLPVSVAAAILVAILFDPARRWAQRFVDRTFFRVRYNYREAQRRFLDEVKQSIGIRGLVDLIVSRADELIPLERIGFFTLEEPGHRLRLLAHKGFDELEVHSVRFELEKLKSTLRLPVALDDKVEAGIAYESAHPQTFRRWGMALVFPMVSERSEILGFLVLGRKKSGRRFTAEDVDLLNVVTTQAGLALERIRLQTKVALEHAEAERLEELSKLKSYFVSSVSHDLKTPLTSIKMFAELLRSTKRVSQKKSVEYLEIIEGESERLTRLINNVLDFSKVERGAKEYDFSEAGINEMVQTALRALRYQLKLQKFSLRVRFTRKDRVIRADADAVVDALVNVLSNAMKYSVERRHIVVSTYRKNDYVAVSVQDRGVGISQKDLSHIFDPYFRSRDEMTKGIGGVGLGLSVVQHVMNAHGGKVEVSSSLGKGTTFKLLFPTEVRGEAYPRDRR